MTSPSRRLAGYGLALNLPDRWEGRVYQRAVSVPAAPAVVAGSAARPSVVGAQSVTSFHREFEHRPTVFDRCKRFRAVFRPRGKHEVHELQIERHGGGRGRVQVTVVDGVERTAEKADQRCRISPLPKTTNFCVVRPSSPTGPRACSLSVEMPISAPRPYS